MEEYLGNTGLLGTDDLPVIPDKKEVFKEAVCECPVCRLEGRDGKIYEGEKSFYCSRHTDKKCDFLLYKNNIEKLTRRQISRDDVKRICEHGSLKTTCTKINDDNATYEGIFTLKPMGKYLGLKLSLYGMDDERWISV